MIEQRNKDILKFYETLKDLRTDKNFSLFHPEILTLEALDKILVPVFKGYKGTRRSSNRIYIPGRGHIWVTGVVANSIFVNMLAYLKEYSAKTCTLDNKTYHIIEDKKDTFDTLAGYAILRLIQKYEGLTGKQMEVSIAGVFKVLFAEEGLNFTYLVKTRLSDLFLTNQRRHKGSVEITRSNVAYELGITIIKLLISQYPKVDTFFHKISPEDLNSLSDVEAGFLGKIIDGLNNGNAKESTHGLYSEFDVFDEHHQRVIDIYINSTITMFLFRGSNYVPQKFKFLVHNHNKGLFVDAQRKMFTKTIQIGNLLINCLEDAGILGPVKRQQGKKTINCVTVINMNLFQGLLDYHLFKKPLLSTKILKEEVYNDLLKKQSKKNAESGEALKDLLGRADDSYNLYHILLKEQQRRVHNNQNTVLKTASEELGSYHKVTPKTAYSIDVALLDMFLQNLRKQDKRLMLFYGYSSEYFESIRSKYNNEVVRNTLDTIQTFMLSFDTSTLSFKDLRKRALDDSLTYQGKEIIKTILNKVEQYKYTLVGIIKDAILYSKFEHFLADSFIDSRGRLYNRESFLNIQNHPEAKMFIKVFTSPERQELTENTWLFMKSHLDKTFDFEEHKMLTLSARAFNELNEAEVKNYLYRLFNVRKLSRNVFDTFLQQVAADIKKKALDMNNLVEFAAKYAKKPKLIWAILAKIIRHFQGENIIEFDANNSGLQMLSIFFKDSALAKECNLMGSTSVDAYIVILDSFKGLLSHLEHRVSCMQDKECLTYALTHDLSDNDIDFDFRSKITSYLPTNDKDLVRKQEHSDRLFKIMQRFLTFDLTKSIHLPFIIVLIRNYYNILFDGFSFEQDLSNVEFLIPHKERDLMETVLKGMNKALIPFGVYLLSLRVIFKLERYYNKFHWLRPRNPIWDDRDLFKKPLMTLYYNARSITRRGHFETFLDEKHASFAGEKQKYAFKYLVGFLDRFFSNYVSENVKEHLKLRELTKCLVDKNTTVSIRNNYFHIDINPIVNRSIQIESRDLYKRRQQLSVKLPTLIADKNRMRLIISPNVIHSMDAFIAHDFIQSVTNMNTLLRERKHRYTLGCYTNHDTFACTLPLLSLIFLKRAYCNLIDQDYLQKCLPNLTEEERALFSNGKTAEEFKEEFLASFNVRFMK